MAVYFFVELQLEQRHNFVGTIEELVDAVALIGGLHRNFKKAIGNYSEHALLNGRKIIWNA